MKLRGRLSLTLYGIVACVVVMWWVQHEVHTRVLVPSSSENRDVRKLTLHQTPKKTFMNTIDAKTRTIGDITNKSGANRLSNKTNHGTSAQHTKHTYMDLKKIEPHTVNSTHKRTNRISPKLQTNDKINQQNSGNTLTRQQLDGKINWSNNNPPQLDKTSKRSDSPLTVIVVPFSHTDPGWIQTVESYFEEKVERILDLAVAKLIKYRNMTFIWAEIVFLQMWWNKKDNATQVLFKNLVKEGRLEIVSGSWVMPDESVTHYSSLITTMYEGNSWLYKELGVTPNVTWNVDPFGYSATMPYLWSLFGIKGAYIQRISARYKEYLSDNKSLEFTWQQGWDVDKSLRGMLMSVAPYKLYNIEHTCGPSKGTCKRFDFYYSPISNRIQNMQVKALAKELNNQLRQKAASFRHNTVLLPIGDDFRYFDEREWDNHYNGFKLLMDHINRDKTLGINIKYGTLSDYFIELNKFKTNSAEKFPSYEGDFFPYADEYHVYWTGFYTTHPKLKQNIRNLQEMIKAARVGLVMSCRLKGDCKQVTHVAARSTLDTASTTLSVLQHHDAITGTSPRNTIDDYMRKVMIALKHAESVLHYVVSSAVQLLTRTKHQLQLLKDGFLPRGYDTSIIVYNSLQSERTDIVSLITKNANVYMIEDTFGRNVPFQINPVHHDDNQLQMTLFEIQFTSNFPPMSVQVYNIKSTNAKQVHRPLASVMMSRINNSIIPHQFHNLGILHKVRFENKYLTLEYNQQERSMVVVSEKSSNSFSIDINALAYSSSDTGGAYIFSPTESAKPISDKPLVYVTTGELTQQIHFIYPVVKITISVYNSSLVNEVKARSLGIECNVYATRENFKNNELIMRFKTDVKNNGVFYTDSNGFQMMKRTFISKKLISGNYYPMSTSVVLEDDTRRITLHAAQPHGVSSRQNGWLEVMLQRFPDSDDRRGMSQGIYRSEPYTAIFSLLLENRFSGRNSHTKTLKSHFVPSSVSVHVNDLLQSPVYTLMSESMIPNINMSFLNSGTNIYSRKLNEDISIVFMTNADGEQMEGRQSESEYIVRVVLHRRQTTQGSSKSCIKLSEIFSNFKKCNYIKKMDLGFRETITSYDNSTNSCIIVEPNTISGFEISYDIE